MSGQTVFNLFRMASLIMFLLAMAMLSAITTMHFAIHGAEVQVPSLKGMTVADARSQAAGMGLNLNVDNRYYSGDVAAGHVLSQSPAPGTVVRREWHVRVAESLGPQKVDVPDTVGVDQRVAAFQLRRAGLDVGITAKLADNGVPEGTVISQDPPAHAQGIERPSVNLLVAAPDDETADGYVMPDFIGMPIVTAQSQLAKVGLKTFTPIFIDVPFPPVGANNAPPAPPVAPGSVIAQQPPAGARVDQTAEVRLTVAK
ncbi:MAG TPA: PASTA domain-containing protein [Terracidiphilus sp.]|jgi:beta-lactam-binding protein with PASTA domain|nr:PASTA domain-containing protein [Terracidiphilus sp.]